jgi:hypothetical protein
MKKAILIGVNDKTQIVFKGKIKELEALKKELEAIQHSETKLLIFGTSICGKTTLLKSLFRKCIDSADINNYYCFSLPTQSNLNLTLKGLSADAKLQLLSSDGNDYLHGDNDIFSFWMLKNMERIGKNDEFEQLTLKQQKIIKEYAKLATRTELSEWEVERMGEILELAESDKVLNLLMDEIDNWIGEEMNLFNDENIDHWENQKARLKEFIGLDYPEDMGYDSPDGSIGLGDILFNFDNNEFGVVYFEEYKPVKIEVII